MGAFSAVRMRGPSLAVCALCAIAMVACVQGEAVLPKAVQYALDHPVASAYDEDAVLPETTKPAVLPETTKPAAKMIPLKAAEMKMQLAKSEAKMAQLKSKMGADLNMEKKTAPKKVAPIIAPIKARLAEVPVEKTKKTLESKEKQPESEAAARLDENKKAEEALKELQATKGGQPKSAEIRKAEEEVAAKAKLTQASKPLPKVVPKVTAEQGFVLNKLNAVGKVDYKAKEAKAANRIEQNEAKLEQMKMKALKDKMKAEGVAIALPVSKGVVLAPHEDPTKSSAPRIQALSSSVLLASAVTALIVSGS